MEIIDLFKQPVARVVLNENLISLLKFCLKIKKEDKGRKISNVGGFQSKDIKLDLKEIKNLYNQITLHSNTFIKNILQIDKNVSLNNLWININGHKDYNMVHEHPFSKISGVFYVKTPKDCGNIVFLNDSKIANYINSNNIKEYNQYNSYSWFLPSVENTLYLFPSWFKHYTEPNLSNENRVSISFNLT